MKGKLDPHDMYLQPIKRAYDQDNQEDPCLGIEFTTNLQKITDDFKNSKINDILKIQLKGESLLEVYNNNGEKCGYIVSAAYNGKIIKCIKNHDKVFKAKVESTLGELTVYCS